jgi:ParE toxin of type II toxin-antitoxin system, parDE
MSYAVVVLPGAHADLSELVELDRKAALAALRLATELKENPWLGDELRARRGLEELKDCRRIRFDRDDWTKKPRFRLIYRNKPSDGAPHIVAILAATQRRDLSAYRRAKPRLIERLRALDE